MSTDSSAYGVGDNSYNAAGGLDGLTRLADAFYKHMQSLPEAKTIRDMHKPDLSESSKKLAYFLSGWLGGPKIYSETFGSIIIPQAHKHLDIGHDEVEAWILCMQKAVEEQPYQEAFKAYLIEQLRVPAERIRLACSTNPSK